MKRTLVVRFELKAQRNYGQFWGMLLAPHDRTAVWPAAGLAFVLEDARSPQDLLDALAHYVDIETDKLSVTCLDTGETQSL